MIDLRSDTVTHPSAAMREVMAAAAVGDDVYGEDPTVNALEARVAAMAGMEAGLFVASGTQGNLLALLTHCQRGEEYLTGQDYHSYLYEAGGAATLGGIQPQPLAVEPDGTLALDRVEAHIKPDDLHFARSRLLALENTHHGKVIGLDYLKATHALAERHGLATHLDGARVFNAAAALDVELSAISCHFDSLSLCFSKGLGCPVGAMLCGSAAFIDAARRYRKMLGGGMRQAGILAAAADYALDHHLPDLAEDHQKARWLAERLVVLPGVEVEPVQTNMIYLRLPATVDPQPLCAALSERGVRVAPGRTLRLVVHRDIDPAGIERAAAALAEVLAGPLDKKG
ncbi:low-specificity L-threonine aldolase [Motiliproteus sp. SC1-56]|uniref:low-specificity L-threonine aldolase n=1 Tax=Motiliproteus sp. SC1-56 TaxID=2799565 RepID=UPI001A8CDB95|nr:low-specificity L-threonine aldolase [Motiliproteus sp. SC1-56]